MQQEKMTNILEPQGLLVRKDARENLTVTLAGGELFAKVRLYPAFPMSRRHRFIGFYTQEGREIGLLHDPRQLETESREIVLQECDRIYFMPHITRVFRVEDRRGIIYWHTDTDFGLRSFQIISRTDSIWHIGRNCLLIRDVDGNRYMIADRSRLDRRSQMLIELNI
jgi:hypothetical protein